MIQSSEHITCLAAWQSRSWDMRGKRNTGWNSMWSCAIPAANFLLLIYGYSHNKHRARPARACTPGTRWKESLVQTQISHTHRLEVALMPKCRVWLATAKMAPRLLLANHKVISALPEQTVVSVFVPKWLNPCVPCFKVDISFQTDWAAALCFSRLAVALNLEPFIEKSNQPYQTKMRWVTLLWSVLDPNLLLSHLIGRVVNGASPVC